ncbi:oxygen-dependent protoporphyrinogen oxidase [Mariniphaga anaerophila]|uniref:Coproporphyrinogen III oxidase n=1 Tax=Mariniphaga anaerophila TaxID=1484053 RepID=A0A1M5CUQ2_9BACT|nr:protoporphyrinogen oxidase [Mariniphaga anaerophila]SHF58449.1 oxygen-dependent protoporphyrinogen oxidase [Mariniphaga anaerophila]
MEDKENIRVAIAGAGLTGLTTAFYLKKAGIPFVVFEKEDRPGGVIQTHHENGFTFESGPNSGILSKPEVVELLEELQHECTLEVADDAAEARWIWKNNRWVPLPSGLVSGISTPLFSFPDKLRLLGEPFRKKGTNPNESLAQLVLRRMGKSFLNYAIDPFILGIYSGDPGRLVTQYAFPKLYNLEQNYGSFIGGALKKAKEPKSERDKKATKEIFSVKGGLSNMIHALATNVGEENIRLNSNNLSFAQKGSKFLCSQSSEEFSHVISTTGGYALPELFPFLEKEKLGSITQMEYSKVIQVSVGFNNWHGIPLNAFGGLVPFIEQRKILGALFLSSFFKDKAPEKGALLSVFLGGIRRPEIAELSDEKIVEIVRTELTEMFHLKKFEPDLLKIFRYSHAIPQYGFESEEKLKTIETLEKQHPGLILAGNIRDGIGIADRINQGRTVAAKIANIEHE